MPVERSAGIILFRNTPEGRKYLVLRSSYHGEKGNHIFWDFPKGLLDQGENGLDAAKREAKEEAGMEDFELLPGFKETVSYFTRREGKPTPKFVAMFLAQTQEDKVKLSWEHDDYEWLAYDEARERITVPQIKSALESAEKFLNAHNR